VDYAQLEGTLQLVGPAWMDFALNGRVAGPLGNRHPVGAMAPHGVFPALGADRWIAIAVADDAEWRSLAAVIDEAWARDPALARASGRLRDLDSLHRSMSDWTRRSDSAELAERLQQAGVAATRVFDVCDLLDDAHYRARGTFIRVRHPLGFEETIYGAYVKTSRTVPDIRPGPAIGQDNERAFLDLLGLPEARYRELIRRRVIF
jgi:benzylsuccinate CoA-transferase BbsF subunit